MQGDELADVTTRDVVQAAVQSLDSLVGRVFDVVAVTKPVTSDAAVNLAKVISKLSPFVGNTIEFNTVELLNDQKDFREYGEWQRQDPGFPDAIFVGSVQPTPGFEIKAWLPLATEITARFRDSQNHFEEENTHVAILAWLPEQLIFGKPKILGVRIVSALSIARARDEHYHNPPDYVVLEPGDTSERTQNLQQTNTAGYKWQGDTTELAEARELISNWGIDGTQYKPTREYQFRVRELPARYDYRLDTNFAKLDRIMHADIEDFKSRIYDLRVHGMTVREWNKLLSSQNDFAIKASLKEHLGIIEEDPEDLVQ